MYFQYPIPALCGIAAVSAAATYFYLRRRRALSFGGKSNADSKNRIEATRYWLVLLASLSLVIAMGNPYWRTIPQTTVRKGTDLIILLDVSQSMYCVEGGSRRIEKALHLLRALLPEFQGSEIAIIYFAGESQIGTPFTTDLAAVQLFLESVVPGMTAKAGTSSVSLQRTLLELLQEQESRKSYLALLLSDGEFFDSTAGWRSFAAREDLTLFAVSVGKERAPVPRFDLSASFPGAFSQAAPKKLQELAVATGGRYFDLLAPLSSAVMARNLATDIEEVSSSGREVPDYQHLPFLTAAMVLLILYQFFPFLYSLVRRPAYRQAVAVVCLVIFSAAMIQKEDVRALFLSAQKDSREKRYGQALKKMQQLQKQGLSEEIEVAIGNIYLDQNKYDEAIRYYKKALDKNPVNEAARWNWEVALKRQSVPNQPPEPEAPPQPEPTPLPDQKEALLKYFEQQEKDEMKNLHSQQNTGADFAW